MKYSRRRIISCSLLTVLVVLLMGAGVVVWGCWTQAREIAHSPRSQPNRTPADVGIAIWETVHFTTTDGLRLEGWYIPPKPERNGASLIFVHGKEGNREDLLNEAAFLVHNGYGALLFDLRNHGSSEGKVTTMGLHEIRDVQAAFDFFEAQPGVNPERIGLYGFSLGAATAIQAMPQIPSAWVLITESSFASFSGIVSDSVENIGLPAWPIANLVVYFAGRESGTDLRNVRPVEDIARIAPRPVLIIHGSDDGLIPIEHARQLYEAAHEPKELFIVSGADHGGFLAFAPDAYAQHVLWFLERAESLN